MEVPLLLPFMLLYLSIPLLLAVSQSPISLKKNSLADGIGFTVPLFHMLDSPLSPYYSAEMTDQERIRLFHDSLRAPNFTMLIDRKSYSIRDYLPLTALRSGYMVSYEIGTPRTVTYSFMDNGSFLTWLQCKPCKRCYKQEKPIFDPTSSLTCSKLPCLHQECYDKRISKCDDTDNTCPYTYSYADGGYSTGYLSTDTITTYRENGSIAQYPEFVFGCGNDNVFKVNGAGMYPPGIFGLNRHELSFVSQLGIGKFSFCLPQRKGLLGPRRNNAAFRRSYSNSLRFGKAALVQGVKTSMQKVQDSYKNHYFIGLEGISFDFERVFDWTGPLMLLDTGNSESSLPAYIYDKLIDVMRKRIEELFVLETVKGELCVKASKWSDLKELMPALIFHIAGFDYKLSIENTWFYDHDVDLDGVYCLAMQRDDPGVTFAVLGAHQMQSINIGINLVDREIYFDTTIDCNSD